MMPVIAPCRSGEHQTMPSDHVTRSRSSRTFGWSDSASSGSGRPEGSKVRVSAPKRRRMRAASSATRRLKDRFRSDPWRRRMRGGWEARGGLNRRSASIGAKLASSIFGVLSMESGNASSFVIDLKAPCSLLRAGQRDRAPRTPISGAGRSERLAPCNDWAGSQDGVPRHCIKHAAAGCGSTGPSLDPPERWGRQGRADIGLLGRMPNIWP